MLFFFFNDTATTEIYTLSLHDALPISGARSESTGAGAGYARPFLGGVRTASAAGGDDWRYGMAELSRRHVPRSEEHTSELQSRQYLVCRLLLEKKKIN